MDTSERDDAWKQWKVGDYILAGDGPLCVYMGLDSKGRPKGRILATPIPWEGGRKVGETWSLCFRTPFNRRLTQDEALKLGVSMKLGLVHTGESCHESK